MSTLVSVYVHLARSNRLYIHVCIGVTCIYNGIGKEIGDSFNGFDTHLTNLLCFLRLCGYILVLTLYPLVKVGKELFDFVPQTLVLVLEFLKL